MVFKAMLLLKPRWLGSILDDYWGRVLFIFVVTFSFIPQFGRSHLKTFKYNIMQNFYSGRFVPVPVQKWFPLYWKIFLLITLGLCLLSCIVIVTKMVIEYYKHKNLVQQININLGPNPRFNTSKHNKSILTSPTMISVLFMFISGLIFGSVQNIGIFTEVKITKHKFAFFYWFAVFPLMHRIILPSIILYNNPGMRNLMFRSIKDFFHLQNRPHLVHD